MQEARVIDSRDVNEALAKSGRLKRQATTTTTVGPANQTRFYENYQSKTARMYASKLNARWVVLLSRFTMSVRVQVRGHCQSRIAHVLQQLW